MAMEFDSDSVARMAGRLKGELVLPGDAAYEHSRRVWNGAVDKHPAAIAYCLCVPDVVASLCEAREANLAISVRSGGHNVAGKSVAEGGLVIDLSRMKNRAIDERRCAILADAGLTLAEFDGATQTLGLATTMGVNGTTGIAGLTLGGGFGKLGRRFGLACDNLISAEVVTAGGGVLRASADENADLFWGLRGGGGNFGIVTAFEYQLHPIGTEVVSGSIAFPWLRAREAVRLFWNFAVAAPDDLNIDGALFTLDGERMFAISVFHAGPTERAQRMLSPFLGRAEKLGGQPRLARLPYRQVQTGGDATFPKGRRYFWKAQFMRDFPDEAIDILLDHYSRAPSSNALTVFQQVGGAISRVPVGATAYVNRDAHFDCFPVAIWDDPAEDAAHHAWVRDMCAALAPFSTGGVYVNNLGDEGPARVRAAYGVNWTRLSELKAAYDPDNVFSGNQNIPATRL